MNGKIYYQSGYKYQLVHSYTVQTSVIPKKNIKTRFISLDTDGVLIVNVGYAWDGPSGPTIDTKNFMRGSLVHDALYQLIRQEYLSGTDRIKADKELKRICKEDGMCKIRAWWVFVGCKYFGGSATKHKRKILYAP